MITIKRILFPTDFSSCAYQTLDHALYLASKYGATLHMLHAVVLHDDDPHNPAAHFVDFDEICSRLKDLARVQMKTDINAKPDLPRDIVMRQERGVSAPQVILDYCAEQDVDLIVMGTHGRRGLGHLLLGSVAEMVVRRASCPVLTVRERTATKSEGVVERIVVPVDFSEHAGLLLSHAKEIAAVHGATLDLLHVVDEIPYPDFYDTAGYALGRDSSNMERRAREEMTQLFRSAPGPDVDVRYHGITGRASQEIIDFAKIIDADLIVIATHGLSGIKHLLLGSVAERVVRMAPCPVLTVRAFGKSLVGEIVDARAARSA
jgi:nucleotide-binding universal stress UspA family protein